MQIYLGLDPPDLSAVSVIGSCFVDIKVWISDNVLLLNNNKSELLVFGPKSHTDPIIQILNSYWAHEARNLGMVLDLDLSFAKDFNNNIKTGFYQIRNIDKIRSMIYFADAKTLIQAFVSSSLLLKLSLCWCLKKIP